MADPDYSLLTPQQVVRERKRITDMMANGSGADLGTVARMDALLAQQEKKYAENQALLERANADSLGDKPAEYKPGVSPKAKKASSAASGAPRKEPEVIDTDELHRRANARSEEGNAVTGVAPKPAAAEEEPRGMGGSAVSLSDWTGGTHDPSLTPLGQAMAETPDADYGDPVYGGASRGEMVDAGLVGRGDSDAPQTWVPMYDENTRDPYNWDKRGR